MRGTVEGLATARPLGARLPALYQEDDFTQRWLAGFDEIWAPVYATVDALTAYLDPGTAPRDFLGWVAGWLGLLLDPEWSEVRCRKIVREAVGLYALRGTALGLRRMLALVTDLDVEVIDSGGVVVSELPGGEFPGRPEPVVEVRVRAAKPDAIEAVASVVRAWRPAHVRVVVEAVP